MFSDPRHNIEQFGLSDGKIVADFGTGAGHYALEAARAVSPNGKVYAIDVQRNLLERLAKEAQRLHLRDLTIIAGNLEKIGGSKIHESSCDAVIASNILFMLDDRKTFLQEAFRVIKSGGKLLLIDWVASFSHMGPHPDHVIYKDEAVKLGLAAGFKLGQEINAGTHHYGIIFRKP